MKSLEKWREIVRPAVENCFSLNRQLLASAMKDHEADDKKPLEFFYFRRLVEMAKAEAASAQFLLGSKLFATTAHCREGILWLLKAAANQNMAAMETFRLLLLVWRDRRRVGMTVSPQEVEDRFCPRDKIVQHAMDRLVSEQPGWKNALSPLLEEQDDARVITMSMLLLDVMQELAATTIYSFSDSYPGWMTSPIAYFDFGGDEPVYCSVG